MPDLHLDWQLLFLCLLLAVGMFFLLLPTPGDRREGPRTYDTKNIRRIR